MAYVPPVNNTPPTGGPQGSCRTAGCRFEGHRDNGFMCSECSRGWTPQRLEQLRLLRKEAEADKRARYFVDWDEPGVTFAPHEYEQLRRAVESWAELLEHRHPFHTLDVRGGVLADDAAAMMREFFAARR